MFGSIEIESGTKVELTIWPTVIKMDTKMKSLLSIEQRKCRFSDEIPENLTLFKAYSTSACSFDCMLKYRYYDNFINVYETKNKASN